MPRPLFPPHIVAIALAFAVGLVLVQGSAADDVIPLPNAHAHNDYEHPRPLLDALDHGFCSIEADIWLVEGQLLVAHDRDKVHPDRTLEKLYLDPLRERVKANNGSVYPGGPEVILLIDIKGNGAATYPVLRETLKHYADILTSFTKDDITKRAVRAIISGSRPRELMEAQEIHYAAYDGRIEDLGGGASAHFMPLISSSWAGQFRWRGLGDMPGEEREKLRAIVEQAHAEGRMVRFWAIPHLENLWDEIRAAGVDLINADNLSMLRDYLLAQER